MFFAMTLSLLKFDGISNAAIVTLKTLPFLSHFYHLVFGTSFA